MDLSLPNQDYAILRLTKDGYGFTEVLESFGTAKHVVVVTFHLDLRRRSALLNKLRSLPPEVPVTLITSVPDQRRAYPDRESANRAKEKFDWYLREIHPKRFRCSLEAWICLENHAKIVATESLAYIGSQNFADSSFTNFECGTFIRGKGIVASVVSPIVEKLITESDRYFGDARQRFLVLLRSADLSVQSFVTQMDEWTTPVMTYGGDYEDRLDLLLAEQNPIMPSTIEALTESLHDLRDELDEYDELEPALENFPDEAIDAISALAQSAEYANFANHDSDRFIAENLSIAPPAPEDMATWHNDASDSEDEYRTNLRDEVSPVIPQLADAFKVALTALRELYKGVRDAPSGGPLDQNWFDRK